jgi:hypothetical protein
MTLPRGLGSGPPRPREQARAWRAAGATVLMRSGWADPGRGLDIRDQPGAAILTMSSGFQSPSKYALSGP